VYFFLIAVSLVVQLPRQTRLVNDLLCVTVKWDVQLYLLSHLTIASRSPMYSVAMFTTNVLMFEIILGKSAIFNVPSITLTLSWFSIVKYAAVVGKRSANCVT